MSPDHLNLECEIELHAHTRRQLWVEAYRIHATAEPTLPKAAANKADEAVARFDQKFPTPKANP
jgi:hypothetical protein